MKRYEKSLQSRSVFVVRAKLPPDIHVTTWCDVNAPSSVESVVWPRKLLVVTNYPVYFTDYTEATVVHWLMFWHLCGIIPNSNPIDPITFTSCSTLMIRARYRNYSKSEKIRTADRNSLEFNHFCSCLPLNANGKGLVAVSTTSDLNWNQTSDCELQSRPLIQDG